MYDVVISIDIGKTGGIAFFDPSESNHESQGLMSLFPMPVMDVVKADGKTKKEVDLEKLVFLMERPKVHGDTCLVVFENVHAFAGQGVVSVGSLLEQKGMIRGIARALGYAELQVTPTVWQKHFGMVPPKDLKGDSAKKTKTLRKAWLKSKSLEIAKQKFPDTVSKITDHGLSDALLIGLWYLEKE